jgi:hypothetical protein
MGSRSGKVRVSGTNRSRLSTVGAEEVAAAMVTCDGIYSGGRRRRQRGPTVGEEEGKVRCTKMASNSA